MTLAAPDAARPARRGLFGLLGRSQAEIEAEDLRLTCRGHDCGTIAALVPRTVGTAVGVVHSMTLRPAGEPPALHVELYDGTGRLALVWTGRREIAGVRPGAYLRVRGRVSEVLGTPTLFNPSYDLLPRD